MMSSQGHRDSKSSRKSRSHQMPSWESLERRELQLASMQDADIERWQTERCDLERKVQQKSEDSRALGITKEVRNDPEFRRDFTTSTSYYEEQTSYNKYLGGQDICGPINTLSEGNKRSHEDKLKHSRYCQDDKYKQTENCREYRFPKENEKTMETRLHKPVPRYASGYQERYTSQHEDIEGQSSRSKLNSSANYGEENRYKLRDIRKERCRETGKSNMSMLSYHSIEAERSRIKNLPSLLDLDIPCPPIGIETSKQEEPRLKSSRHQDLKSCHSKREQSTESSSKFQSKYYSSQISDQELRGSYNKLGDYNEEEKKTKSSNTRNASELVKNQVPSTQWRERMRRMESTQNANQASEYYKLVDVEGKTVPSRKENNQTACKYQTSESYYKNSSHNTSSHHSYNNTKEPNLENNGDKLISFSPIAMSSDYNPSAFVPVPQKSKTNLRYESPKDNYHRNKSVSSKDLNDVGLRRSKDCNLEIQNCDMKVKEPKKYEKPKESLKIRIKDKCVEYMVVPVVDYAQYTSENHKQIACQEFVRSTQEAHEASRVSKNLAQESRQETKYGTKVASEPEAHSESLQVNKEERNLAVRNKNLTYNPESRSEPVAEKAIEVSPLIDFQADHEEFEFSLGRGCDKKRRPRLNFRSGDLKSQNDAELDLEELVPEAENNNFILLNLESGKGIFEYEINCLPEINSREIHLFLLVQLKFNLGDAMLLEGTTLYLPFQLPHEVIQQNAVHPYDGSPVEVVLKFRGQRKAGESTYAYNLLLKQTLVRLRLARLNFDPDVPELKLEEWPGYIRAVEEHKGGIQLIFDTSVPAPTVLELINTICTKYHQGWKDIVKSTLLGYFVRTSFNQRLYQIDDIDFSSNPRSTFLGRNGVEISYAEYYSKQYSLHIRDTGQPLLTSKFKRKQDIEQVIVLVPELCYLLDEKTNDTKDLTVDQQQADLENYICCFQTSKKVAELLKPWGLSVPEQDKEELNGIEVDLMTFPSGSENEADQPLPLNRENHTVKNTNNSGAHEDIVQPLQLTAGVVKHSVNVVHWAIVYSQHDAQYTSDLRHFLKQTGSHFGIRINKPLKVMIRSEKIETYLRALKEVAHHKLQLMVIIIPPARKGLYAAVKRACGDKLSIIFKIIPSGALERRDNMKHIVENIALQIHWQLPGSLRKAPRPYKNCMVVGIATIHKMKGSQACNVAGFVASLNTSFTHWYTKAITKSTNSGLQDAMSICFIQALHRYNQVNNKLPEHVLMFRDGTVNESQLQVEVEEFRSCFIQLSSNFDPKFTHILVNKRIYLQFSINISTESQDEHFDYLIVSQSVCDRSVTPTHCVITYDDSGIKKSHIQYFTSLLCHMYCGSPGELIKPAPCQYAYKFAQLVTTYVKQKQHRLPLSEPVLYL